MQISKSNRLIFQQLPEGESHPAQAEIVSLAQEDVEANIYGYFVEDFAENNVLTKVVIATRITEEIAKKYEKGEKLLKKEGVTWTWLKPNGVQDKEIIPFYKKHREYLLPILQTLLTDLKDARAERLKKKHKAKFDAEHESRLDEIKTQIIDRIIDSFGDYIEFIEDNDHHFWENIYASIKDGYCEYEHTPPYSFRLYKDGQDFEEFTLFTEENVEEKKNKEATEELVRFEEEEDQFDIFETDEEVFTGEENTSRHKLMADILDESHIKARLEAIPECAIKSHGVGEMQKRAGNLFYNALESHPEWDEAFIMRYVIESGLDKIEQKIEETPK